MAMIVDGNPQRAAINVTPMVDVLLVLLIIFMAIAPEKQHGMDTAMPQRANKTDPQESENPLVLAISQDGSYSLNSRPVEARELSARLGELLGTRAQPVLFVQAARDLEFRKVVEAIDVARGAGITRIAFMPRT